MVASVTRVIAAVVALVIAGVAAAQSSADTLGRIKRAKQINVAYSGDSAPFSFVGQGDQPAGYSIDLCKRVIARISSAVGVPELRVNWRVGSVAERIAMIKSGKADLDCANTTASLARMKDVDFSALVFVDSGGFMVKAGSDVKRFADLAGKKIAVIGGTTTETRLASAMKAKLVNAEVVKINDGAEGPAMLLSGAVDAYASDKVKLIGLALQSADPQGLRLLEDDLSYEPLAFATPRGDWAMRLEVNSALSQVYASGDIEEIYIRWFGRLGRPSALLAAMYLLQTSPQ
jgi:ABC-type amino acid transport substrate-binding protein